MKSLKTFRGWGNQNPKVTNSKFFVTNKMAKVCVEWHFIVHGFDRSFKDINVISIYESMLDFGLIEIRPILLFGMVFKVYLNFIIHPIQRNILIIFNIIINTLVHPTIVYITLRISSRSLEDQNTLYHHPLTLSHYVSYVSLSSWKNLMWLTINILHFLS